MNSNITPGGFNQIGSNRYCKPVAGGIAYYSYSTLVIIYRKYGPDYKVLDCPVIYKTSQYYSVTTSRHINQIIKDIVNSLYPVNGKVEYKVIPLDQAALNKLALE